MLLSEATLLEKAKAPDGSLAYRFGNGKTRQFASPEHALQHVQLEIGAALDLAEAIAIALDLKGQPVEGQTVTIDPAADNLITVTESTK